MLVRLFLLFTIVPIVEIYVLFAVGHVIGWQSTIALVIATALIGSTLARTQGLQVLRQIQGDLSEGHLPTESLLDGFMILCGGLLLLTPGIITDCIGLMALFPPTRRFIKEWVKSKLRRMIQSGSISFRSSWRMDDDSRGPWGMD